MLPSVQAALKVLQATMQGAATDLAHSGGRDGAEGPDEVGLDPGGRLEGEHTGSPPQVHWHLNRGRGEGGGRVQKYKCSPQHSRLLKKVGSEHVHQTAEDC